MNKFDKVWRVLSFLCIVFLLIGSRSYAQVIVTGKVYDRAQKEILYRATVKNKRTGEVNLSDQGGNYRIGAEENDVILFSYVGYDPDSITVTVSTGSLDKDIFLQAATNRLSEVEINAGLTPYQVDSINRRQQFGYYLDKPKYNLFGGTGGNTNTPEGFGISISPFTHFSKEERDKRKFDALYAKEERQRFIDSRYTAALVSRITHLQGDSLAYFMNSHQPDYEFVRTASDWEFMYWIKYTFKSYEDSKKNNKKEEK